LPKIFSATIDAPGGEPSMRMLAARRQRVRGVHERRDVIDVAACAAIEPASPNASAPLGVGIDAVAGEVLVVR